MSALTPVTIDGMTYASASRACDALGVERARVARFGRKRGLTFAQAIVPFIAATGGRAARSGQPSRTVVFGVEHPTVEAARRAHGLTKGQVDGRRTRHGITTAEAIEMLVRERDPDAEKSPAAARPAQPPPAKIPRGRIVHPTDRPNYQPSLDRPRWAIEAAIREGR